MSEATIAFLSKASSLLFGANGNKTQEILKSYYMMRCKDISKGYGLPQKHFAQKIRCPHCCLEWGKASKINVRSVKLTKRQKKRIKLKKKLETKGHLFHSNELEQICNFCGHITKTVIPKPDRPTILKRQETKVVTTVPKKIDANPQKKTQPCHLYSSTVQVFTLNNKKNVLQSTIKEEPKIIKNNKKRKDKFAGLCQKAVLASAKLKQGHDKQNKLNLFLKPAS